MRKRRFSFFWVPSASCCSSPAPTEANLFLVRAETRQRELALRMARGASRRDIALSFVTEGLVLALAGGGLGLFMAHAATRWLIGLAPEGVPRLHHVGLQGPVLIFAVVASFLSAVLFALLPALPYGRPDVVSALHEGGRGAVSGSRVRLRRALVGLQVALALMLLVGAGLMVQSFRRLLDVEPGFDEAQALTLRLSLPAARYPSSRWRLETTATPRSRATSAW
jgi:hypothetical protein